MRLSSISRGFAQIDGTGGPPMRVHRDDDGLWEVSIQREDGRFYVGEMGAMHRRRRDAIAEALSMLTR